MSKAKAKCSCPVDLFSWLTPISPPLSFSKQWWADGVSGSLKVYQCDQLQWCIQVASVFVWWYDCHNMPEPDQHQNDADSIGLTLVEFWQLLQMSSFSCTARYLSIISISQHMTNIWGLLCKKQVSRAGTSSYIPQVLWDVITHPCPWYLFLAKHSSHVQSVVLGLNRIATNLGPIYELKNSGFLGLLSSR